MRVFDRVFMIQLARHIAIAMVGGLIVGAFLMLAFYEAAGVR